MPVAIIRESIVSARHLGKIYEEELGIFKIIKVLRKPAAPEMF